MGKMLLGWVLAVLLLATACQRAYNTARPASGINSPGTAQHTSAISSPVLRRVVEDALDQTVYTTQYDPSYVKLDYPGGDVAPEKGVCADVIVRAFRKGGIDLQKAVHEDMGRSFSAYPQKWGLTKPDPNIDHRRVLNLMTYFERQGKALAVSSNAKDYLPGDVVAWDLSNNHPHIGIVTNVLSDETRHYYVVHNVGAGARAEDVMFAWRIIGHYRYF